ncbi:MAG TPA: hypothetical protein VFB51_06585 [Solirubrobacterales bacterium]|nr:hypothetical protein [Solirubrobacterales bacterium]
MHHHMKMMWVCGAAAVAAVAVAAVVPGIGLAALVFVLPCALMMLAMAWMMLRMARQGRHRR